MKKLFCTLLFLSLLCPSVFAATVTRYINTASSGGDGTTNATSGANAAYASCSAWEAAEQTDLDTANNIMLVYASGTTADTTACAIAGWTTSATDYIDFQGNNTSGKYNTSAYRIEVSGNGSAAFTITTVPDVYVTKLQAYNTYGTNVSGSHGISIAGQTTRAITIQQTIARGPRFGLFSTSAGTMNLYNSAFYWGTSSVNQGGAGINSTGIFVGYNNVFAGNASGGITGDMSGGETAKNCYAYSASASAAWNVAFGTMNNNASNDASHSTTSVAYSTSSGAYFTNIGDGTEDFHIGASSALKDAGADLSGTFTTDIDGETRSGTWDIGVDEYVVAAAAARKRLITFD